MKVKLLVVFLGMIFTTALYSQKKIELDSKQIREVIKKDDQVICIDVRTVDEFRSGHLKGALNIDVRQENAFDKMDKLNRNAKYIVYCRTNHRSGIATDYMIQKGFKFVYQMMDGYTGWVANNFSIEK